MPFYEYECQSCKFYTELMQKISDPPLEKCPSCGKKTMQKLISAPVFRLKGSGWYETDFKGDNENKRNLAGADKEESKSDDSSSSGSSDSKKSESKDDAKAKTPAETKSPTPAVKTAAGVTERPARESRGGAKSGSSSGKSSGRAAPSKGAGSKAKAKPAARSGGRIASKPKAKAKGKSGKGRR